MKETLGTIFAKFGGAQNKLHRRIYLGGTLIAFSVFVFALVLTFIAWRYNVQVFNLQSQLRFDTVNHNVVADLQNKANRDMDVLLATQGFFSAAASINQKSFHDFVGTLDITSRYPSLYALNYIKRVPESSKNIFLQSVRNDSSVNKKGSPNFTITPTTTFSTYDILTYSHARDIPFPAIGTNVSADASFKAAIEQARDEAKPIVFNTLMSTSDGTQVFAVLVPIYTKTPTPETVALRRAAFRGVIEGVFELKSFFNEAFPNKFAYQGVNFDVYYGENLIKDNVLYSNTVSPVPENENPEMLLVNTSKVIVANTPLTVTFSATRQAVVGGVTAKIPRIIGLGGILASLSLFVLVLSFTTSRRRATELANMMTSSIKEKNEQLEASTALLQHETHKINAIFSSMAESLIAIDDQGRVKLLNQAASVTLGIAEGDAHDKKIEEILPLFRNKVPITEKESPVYYAIREKSIARTLLRDDMYTMGRDGNTFPIVLSATSLLNKADTGGVSGIIMFRDVTVEKSIDQSKTEFVSLASHQLRTPLTAIGWYTEMLMSNDVGKTTKKQREYLSEISTSTKRMVDLMNALLNVSRIDLGTFAIEPEMVDVTEIAESVIKEQEPTIALKKMKVTHAYDKGIPKMSMDPRLTRIVFQNLLSNAIKYTPEKGSIHMAVEKQKDKIRISVSDNGYGIPKSNQVKIFTKLYRADNILIKDTDGTGLGLYIVKEIVEQSGGSISFTSEENKGTTFYVIFPKEGMKPKKGTKGLS